MKTRLSGPVIGCGDAFEFAESLGARVAEHQPQAGRVTVMLDPAGHPFCLFPGRV
jgi:hypothetical protein